MGGATAKPSASVKEWDNCEICLWYVEPPLTRKPIPTTSLANHDHGQATIFVRYLRSTVFQHVVFAKHHDGCCPCVSCTSFEDFGVNKISEDPSVWAKVVTEKARSAKLIYLDIAFANVKANKWRNCCPKVIRLHQGVAFNQSSVKLH